MRACSAKRTPGRPTSGTDSKYSASKPNSLAKFRVDLEMLPLIARFVAERRVAGTRPPTRRRRRSRGSRTMSSMVAMAGEPRVPHRFAHGCVPSPFTSSLRARIGHHRQMGAGMARVGRSTNGHVRAGMTRFAGPFARRVRRRETGNPTADHDHIRFGAVGKLGKLGETWWTWTSYGVVSVLVVAMVIPFNVRISACGAWTGFDSGDHRLSQVHRGKGP